MPINNKISNIVFSFLTIIVDKYFTKNLKYLKLLIVFE